MTCLTTYLTVIFNSSFFNPLCSLPLYSCLASFLILTFNPLFFRSRCSFPLYSCQTTLLILIFNLCSSGHYARFLSIHVMPRTSIHLDSLFHSPLSLYSDLVPKPSLLTSPSHSFTSPSYSSPTHYVCFLSIHVIPKTPFHLYSLFHSHLSSLSLDLVSKPSLLTPPSPLLPPPPGRRAMVEEYLLCQRTSAIWNMGRRVHLLLRQPAGGDRLPARRLGGGSGRRSPGGARHRGLR